MKLQIVNTFHIKGLMETNRLSVLYYRGKVIYNDAKPCATTSHKETLHYSQMTTDMLT